MRSCTPDEVVRRLHSFANGTHESLLKSGFTVKPKGIDLRHYRKHRQQLRNMGSPMLRQVIGACFDEIDRLEKVTGDKCQVTGAGPVVEWHPRSALPDAEITVLMALDNGDVEPGFMDENGWCYASGGAVNDAQITHWAHMPEAP